MTRFPERSVALLAVTCCLGSSLLFAGCGRTDAPQSPLAVTSSESEPVAVLASPPQLFAAPDEARPLPSPTPAPAARAAQSVQVQYSQASKEQPPVAAAQATSIYAPQPAAHVVQQPARAAGPHRVSAAPVARAPHAQQTLFATERATAMAQKGMLFAAKEELVKALAEVAQSRDQEQGTTWHLAALAAGWRALDEAPDFAPQACRTGGLATSEIIRSHRTTILQAAGEVPPSIAQQYYVGYAQQQLALAVGGEPATSQTLHVLGRVHAALAGSASQAQSLHSQRALALYQAALAVDPRNYQAANELGVLLAGSGQLAEAKLALLQSISIQPHPASWHNLATVHRRLGETELAALAEGERRQLAAGAPARTATSSQTVAWVDAATFAASGRGEAGQAQVARAPSAANSTSSQRR